MASQDTPDTTRGARFEVRVSAAQKSLLQHAAALSGRHVERVRRRQRTGRSAPGDRRARVHPAVARRAAGLRASLAATARAERAPEARGPLARPRGAVRACRSSRERRESARTRITPSRTLNGLTT